MLNYEHDRGISLISAHSNNFSRTSLWVYPQTSNALARSTVRSFVGHKLGDTLPSSTHLHILYIIMREARSNFITCFFSQWFVMSHLITKNGI